MSQLNRTESNAVYSISNELMLAMSEIGERRAIQIATNAVRRMKRDGIVVLPDPKRGAW